MLTSIKTFAVAALVAFGFVFNVQVAHAESCADVNAAIIAHNHRYNPNPTKGEAASYNAEADVLDARAAIACQGKR
jgi:hypothetical protein